MVAAPAPYFHPLFLIFQITPPPLSRGGNQNLLPPLKQGRGGPNYVNVILVPVSSSYLKIFEKY